MKTRPVLLLLGVLGAAAVASGAELKHTPPAKVDLSGLWKINPDLSDDPYKAVEQKRRDSSEGRRRGGGGPMGGSGGGARLPGGIVVDSGDILDGVFGGTVGGSAGTGRRGGGTSDRPAGDPEPTSMRVPLDSFLATLEQFEITQAPDAVTITTEEETSTCKPAAPGQAPLPGGDPGDRRCGWQGNDWVTEIKAPNGVVRTNRFELKKGGRQLVMISEIEGGKAQLSGLRIKRVYDRVLLN
jgi:hypothetical protein